MNASLARGFAAVGLGLVAAGCGTVDIPETNYYRIDLPAPDSAGATEPLSSKCLRIGQTRLAPELLSERLAVRRSDVRLQYYQYHHWAGPLDSLLGDALSTGISRAGCFADVFDDAAVRDFDYVLETDVRTFHLVGTADGWAGEAQVEFRVSTRDGERVFAVERTARERAGSGEPEAAARALSGAVGSLIDDFLVECERHAMFDRAAAAAPPRSAR